MHDNKHLLRSNREVYGYRLTTLTQNGDTKTSSERKLYYLLFLIIALGSETFGYAIKHHLLSGYFQLNPYHKRGLFTSKK
jgi:hypothetical protein